MTERPIRVIGDPVLRTPCEPIREITDGVRTLVADLLETVDHEGRAGLAANQIGVSLRAFSWHLEDDLGYILNPVITDLSEETQDDDEGCLSVPGLWYPRTRAMYARCEGTDLDGKGKDYLAIVPEVAEIGNTPAGNAHKQKMVDKLGQLPALVEKNGDTGLYDSIWAAYQAATKSYRDGYVNSIVVMTDGKNDDPGGGLSLQQLLKNLGGAYKPDKPIKLVAISMGRDTDPAALKQIARATGGLSYVTKDPSEISTVFVDAFLHRS